MNIMLMVVSERTREIGLRKALGAKRRDIMSQVLTESITLSLIGGILGIALGAMFSTIISSLTPVPSSVELWSVALGVTITALVGLFFGWMPGAARGDARPDRSAAAGISDVGLHQAIRAAARDRRHGVRHAAQQQDALGADGARRGDRRDLDRRHDVADPRLRHVAAQLDQCARAEHDHGRSASAALSFSSGASFMHADAAADPHRRRHAGDRAAGDHGRAWSTSGSARRAAGSPTLERIFYRGERTRPIAIMGTTERYVEINFAKMLRAARSRSRK